jgi:hypothetical protein
MEAMKRYLMALLVFFSVGSAWALANGTCAYQTDFTPPIPTGFAFIGTPAMDITTPFFETMMTMNITCVGPMTSNFQQPTVTLFGAGTIVDLYSFSGLSANFGNDPGSGAVVSDTCNGMLLGPGGGVEYQPGVFYRIIEAGNGSLLPSGQTCTGVVKRPISYYTNGNTLSKGSSSTVVLNGITGGTGTNFSRLVNVDYASSTVSGMNAFKIISPSCTATIGMASPFASAYAVAPRPAGSLIVTKVFKIDLTCTPPINIDSWNGESQLVLGVGSISSKVQGGINGVNAKITNLDLDTTQTNCSGDVAKSYTYAATTTTISTSGVTTGTKFTGGTCTNHYLATVEYTTSGAAYNANTSSTDFLTDTANTNYTGFLRPGTSLADLQVNSTLTSFSMQEPMGSCSATISFLDGAYANNYQAVRTITTAPFLSKNVRVQLTCLPALTRSQSSTQLVMGVGNTKSALLGGIAGVQASMTPFTLNALASNCPFGRNFSQTPTTTSIQTNTAVNFTSANGTTCTNTYNATLNYFATGVDFNTTASSPNLLTDNVGTYSNFLKSGTYPGNVTVTATGLNTFTVSRGNCRVVLRSKVKRQG